MARTTGRAPLATPFVKMGSDPFSSARVEVAASDRSDHQMDATAISTTDSAPPMSDHGSMCSVSAVVPTAPTHHVRRPSMMRAAYAIAPPIPATPPMPARNSASPVNSRRIAAGSRPRACNSPTSRRRCSTPSLKNSAREEKRRDDEEEAEIGEVLAEVGRAVRGCEPLGAHVVDRKPHRQRIELAEQLFLISRARVFERRVARRNQTERRQPAVARAPQPLPAFDRDERLRCRAIPVPVLLIDRAHALQVDRERRIPVGHAIGVGDAWILRHQIAIGGGSERWAERARRGTAPLASSGVLQSPRRSNRSRRGLQRWPGDLSRPNRSARWRPALRSAPPHQPIRGREDRWRSPSNTGSRDRAPVSHWPDTSRRGSRPCASVQPLVSPQTRSRRSASCCGCRRRSRPSASSARMRKPKSSATRRLAQSPFDGRGVEVLDENGIGALALIEQRLHSRQRHKDRANRALTGAQRKLAEIFSREHLAHREAEAATQVLFPAMQGLGRYRR